MGKVAFSIDFVNKTVTLDWSALTAEQIEWLGKAQGYDPAINTVEYPENSGTFIPMPVFLFVLNKKLREAADAAFGQYKAGNQAQLDAEAAVVADIL